MSAFLARIAHALTHRWKRSLVAAIVVLVGLGAFAGAFGGMPAEDFKVPGAESQKALELFSDHVPALAGAEANLVFSTSSGSITDPANRRAITSALAKASELPKVAEVGDPFAQVSPNGRVALADVRYTDQAFDIEPEDGRTLQSTLDRALEGTGVQMEMRGSVADAASEQDAPVGELIGVALAIILLTLLFRSGAAMAATLIGALIGVMVGQLALQILAQPLGLPEFATTIAMMLGLGAGIDYALLVIARYREQVAAGDTPPEASAKAAATSGASVVAAGLIVMVAIAGLLSVGIPMIGKMGIGAAIGVAAVVVSSLTILPIMAGALSRWLRPKKPEHVQASAAFGRWAEIITRRPWAAIVAGGVIMLALAIPVTGMHLGQPDDGNQPASKTQRKAYDTVSAAFGPGANGPFLIAVRTPDGSGDKAALQSLVTALRDTDGVASVSPAMPSNDGAMATISLIPDTSPQEEATGDLVHHLRRDVIPAATEGTHLQAYVGGVTATFLDFSEKVASRLPLFIALVVGLSVLLLMAAFRSLWIPLASAVLNVLSVLAAYGLVTLVFQDGVGAGLLGVDSGVPVVSFIPVMLFAILFGLSMDYNVFLLSRIREAHQNGDRPRSAVIHGVSRIGKIVLFAGLIMASVFLAFAAMPDVTAKMMGLGLGLAILLDVVVVRLLIVPGMVTLMGERAWWMPRWLDRVLPNISLDGHEEVVGTSATSGTPAFQED